MEKCPGKNVRKNGRHLGKNQLKLIKSVTSCGGHLARVDLTMYYSSANSCQNQVKVCTLKVQDDVRLAMVKFCLSIKDCRSQTSFNDSTTKGLGPKILAKGTKFLDCYEKICFAFWFQNSN